MQEKFKQTTIKKKGLISKIIGIGFYFLIIVAIARHLASAIDPNIAPSSFEVLIIYSIICAFIGYLLIADRKEVTIIKKEMMEVV